MVISVIIDKLDKTFKGIYNFGNRSLEITSKHSTVPLNLTVFHLVFNKYYLCEGFA